MNKKHFLKHIKDFDFKNLFINLGWDNFSKEILININGYKYCLHGIAEKRGFAIVVCPPESNGEIPQKSTRKKIESRLCKLHQEHLIIYQDKQHEKQIWQFVIHEFDKPRRVREIPYYNFQDPEKLYQRTRGLLFNLEEEEYITLVDVNARVRENLAKNSEKVTKKFYVQFKKNYASFLSFIEGIDDFIKDENNQDKQWYASIMMNRLMFCYFIQKRGYLNNDVNYLQNKLKEVKQKAGRDRFYDFYRIFLIQLFHQGLSRPEEERNLNVELGKIPYLNGGLFDVHELERKFNSIQIKDGAFKEIFDFFDKWNWHLDTRIESTGRDINPDVLGYIFEKYVNDRAAMGAYYTKEDITEYISKNTIIPNLFDKVKLIYPEAFEEKGYIWSFLRNSGDAYIYETVKKGIPSECGLFDDLPEDIKKGFNPDLEKKIVDNTKSHLFEIRKTWNQRAPSEIALPTELYREVIERRKKYAEIKKKIEQGEITEINDFITYNLNIRQFVQDIIENTEDPVLIRNFFKAIAGNMKYKEANEKLIKPISILDPTCGSGAFLFAAMNILEPLYEACIEKMEQFTSEYPRRYKFFHKVLADVNSEEHPNLKYYIYKSIILKNLYGVDIMHEAVEIAKLRLFLKMVGTVESNINKPNFGLEPLPDIDFNIKVGNTLVGFATEKELFSAIKNHEDLFLFDDDKLTKYIDECSIVATAYKRFRDEQFIIDKNTESQRNAKSQLQNRLNNLNKNLNKYLVSTYGIKQYEDFGGNTKLFSSDDTLKQYSKEYEKWLKTHQPFHWFAEFYEIVNENGGFDVIIGNPPYVEYSKIKKIYKINNYQTITCGNLYANVVERCHFLLKENSKISMIVQLPIVCTDRMKPIQNILKKEYHCQWFATFDDRPGKLFDGLEHIRATIFIVEKFQSDNPKIYTTFYNRWYSETRQWLFDFQSYLSNQSSIFNGTIPKVGNKIAAEVLKKIKEKKELYEELAHQYNNNILYYHNSSQYFIRATLLPPYFWNEREGKKISVQIKSLHLSNHKKASMLNASLNSALFYFWFIIMSDCRHLNMREINNFRISLESIALNDLIKINNDLMEDLNCHSHRKECFYKSTGKVIYDEYYPKKSKHIADKIDKILARHYGFTEEELDFIINYDIKYRMGEELFNNNN